MTPTQETIADTQEVEFIRDYKVSVERLWAAVTDPNEVVQWFGPEGIEMLSCDMNLAQRGPWHCKMKGLESGRTFHVSGVVTHTRPPERGADASTGFTWAWHDEDSGERGVESHVIFEVSAHDGGARLRLVHRNLPDIEQAQGHTKGWLSTLGKLETHISN